MRLMAEIEFQRPGDGRHTLVISPAMCANVLAARPCHSLRGERIGDAHRRLEPPRSAWISRSSRSCASPLELALGEEAGIWPVSCDEVRAKAQAKALVPVELAGGAGASSLGRLSGRRNLWEGWVEGLGWRLAPSALPASPPRGGGLGEARSRPPTLPFHLPKSLCLPHGRLRQSPPLRRRLRRRLRAPPALRRDRGGCRELVDSRRVSEGDSTLLCLPGNLPARGEIGCRTLSPCSTVFSSAVDSSAYWAFLTRGFGRWRVRREGNIAIVRASFRYLDLYYDLPRPVPGSRPVLPKGQGGLPRPHRQRPSPARRRFSSTASLPKERSS